MVPVAQRQIVTIRIVPARVCKRRLGIEQKQADTSTMRTPDALLVKLIEARLDEKQGAPLLEVSCRRELHGMHDKPADCIDAAVRRGRENLLPQQWLVLPAKTERRDAGWRQRLNIVQG